VSEKENRPAFETIARERIPRAHVVTPTLSSTSNRDNCRLVIAPAVPLCSQFREHAAAGGLLSLRHRHHRRVSPCRLLCRRILKGDKPAICRSCSRPFRPVHNFSTAKAPRLALPSHVACPRRRGDRLSASRYAARCVARPKRPNLQGERIPSRNQSSCSQFVICRSHSLGRLSCPR